jgi:hypothetical protein
VIGSLSSLTPNFFVGGVHFSPAIEIAPTQTKPAQVKDLVGRPAIKIAATQPKPACAG